MGKYILECCVGSVESAIAAARGGADRLELCANLVIGATTPGRYLYEAVRAYTNIPIHVLIRPRFGDFLYSPYEFEQMKREVREYRLAGADGIVIGCLEPQGNLDVKRMKELIGEAGRMHVTLHRAFDMCEDPITTLEAAKEIGVHTILTSGQREVALKGKNLLNQLCLYADGKVEIMAGSGINAAAIGELLEATRVTTFHMSGKKIVESGMEYRKKGVHMGLPGLSEYERWETDEEEVRAARRVLKQKQEQEDA